MYEKSGIKSVESEECELHKSSCHYWRKVDYMGCWGVCSHPSPKITIFNSNFTSLTLHTHNRSNRTHIFFITPPLFCLSHSAPCGLEFRLDKEPKRRKKIQQKAVKKTGGAHKKKYRIKKIQDVNSKGISRSSTQA